MYEGGEMGERYAHHSGYLQSSGLSALGVVEASRVVVDDECVFKGRLYV